MRCWMFGSSGLGGVAGFGCAAAAGFAAAAGGSADFAANALEHQAAVQVAATRNAILNIAMGAR